MEDLKTGINYAVKIVDKKALAKKNKNPFMRDSSGDLVVDNQLQDAMREIAIMTKLHHDNIIKLHRVIHDDQEGNMYLVMECCDKGPLMDYDDFTGEFTVNKNYINEEKGKFFYSEEEIKDIIRGVILGIDYLHFNNIIHKDLKHNNIILGENCQPKIIDFNISKIFSAKKKMDTKTEGTYEFMAPESFELSSDSNSTCILGKPLDIWALGVTVFIMVYNQLPFQTENFGDQIGLMNTITDAV
jgi:serine/threonine protein kinase